MLQLGQAGTGGYEPGVAPILADGAVAAVIRFLGGRGGWRPGASVLVDGQEWVYSSKVREIHGRWAQDPEDAARYRARQRGLVRDLWQVDLEGLPVDVRGSLLTGEHRYLIDGAVVAATATVDKRLQFHGGAGLTWPQLVFLFWLELSIRRRNADLPVIV
jgi:hypothetical protein